MNDLVKRRSLAVLESLGKSADEVEYLADEVLRMLIRGDENGRVPVVMSQRIEAIKDAVATIQEEIGYIESYVNRKQPTHRL